MYPGAPAASDALRAVAFCQEQLEDVQSALNTYQSIIDRFPGTNEAAIAQYRMGLDYETALNDIEHAVQAYEIAISEYPGNAQAEFAAEAMERVSAL